MGNADRSTAELLKQLSDQTRTLVREEIRLARIELGEKGRNAGLGAGLVGGAGIVAMYGAAVVIGAVVAALALVLPVWAAALIVGAVLLATAAALGVVGRNRVRRAMPPVPAETVEDVKKDVEIVRERTHR